MPNKMLIDASHPEETRVVVTRGNRIEEFDFESQDKKQLKGNIYLARVTRVEPSLQAAFVEYGGNRHGFLAFSEIHPDYYQIPVADRQALLRAEAEAHEDEDDEDDEERGERNRGRRRRRGGGRNRDREERHAGGREKPDEAAEGNGEAGEALHSASEDDADSVSIEEFETPEAVMEDRAEGATGASDEAAEQASSESEDDAEDEPARDGPSMPAAIDADVISEPVPENAAGEEDASSGTASEERAAAKESPSSEEHGGSEDGGVEEVHHAEESEVESVGAEDALEEVRSTRRPVRRNYKIQEVIKRRQILLVQVVKEERGNKGAALTTYLSLAGRYSVLMPNTARGGGISRKITNAQDRKRLKEVVADLEVPQGMGVILRTAGESRTKAEIKRDYEYLMRLWENVRTLTLQSTAPALVYEEGSLIKRSVRDLYNKDIDEILVSGEDGYREAKDFMRMLMPSHAKAVQPYRETVPIFARAGIEAQLDRMLQPQVTLKSGGYIIINQTEALVSIDVNSGRSTKEHSIEDTALQTNLEAAEEVARQLRLRDLAGLIVIDFIDMEENRNNRSVEKRLKDCLKNDRARIQVGRISHFGLLEMSRQRIRASVLESTMKPCPHCGGTGHVRSDSSVALHVVRAIEEFLLKDSRNHITCKTPSVTALYVLNHKRSTLVEMEKRFGVNITIEADETLGAQPYLIVRGAVAEKSISQQEATPAMPLPPEPDDDVEIEPEVDAADERRDEPVSSREGDDHHDRKRRRRRRRRGGRDHDQDQVRGGDHSHGRSEAGVQAAEDDAADAEDDAGDEQPAQAVASGDTTTPDGERKKRRRGKRGGRRNRGDAAGETSAEEASDESEAAASTDVEAAEDADDEPAAETSAAAPEPVDRDEPKAAIAEEAAAESVSSEPVVDAVSEDNGGRVHRTRRRTNGEPESQEAVVVSSNAETVTQTETKPKKGGWWQRKGFF